MPLQHNLEHRYALKTAMEQLLGREAWSSLKETTSVAVWRKYILKTLKAIRLSIRETVRVRDEAWADAIEENLSRGEK